MRTLRVGSWISLLALGQLLVASAAHAQGEAPAGAPPPPPEGVAAPSPPPPPSAWAGAAPQLQQPMVAPPGPVVRLTTDKPARLQMMQLRWRDICSAPCGVVVDPNGVYRVGGGTVRPSDEFRMPRPAGTVLVQAEVGSTVKHWVGIGMLIGGSVAALGGLAYYAAGSSTTTDVYGNTIASDTYKAVGITYIVIGVIVAAIGIPLSMSSTSVDVR